MGKKSQRQPFCRDNFSPLSANLFQKNIQLDLSKSYPKIKFQALIFWLKNDADGVLDGDMMAMVMALMTEVMMMEMVMPSFLWGSNPNVSSFEV